MTLFMIAVVLFSTCGKLPMEEAQDAYDATKVVPVVFATSGPTTVLQTFPSDYKISYNRVGSTWSWSATDAVVQSVSEDTKTATIMFSTMPASGKALVKVIEKTAEM